jgi:hypothetical protein
VLRPHWSGFLAFSFYPFTKLDAPCLLPGVAVDACAMPTALEPLHTDRSQYTPARYRAYPPISATACQISCIHGCVMRSMLVPNVCIIT